MQEKEFTGLHTYNVDANVDYRKLFALDMTLIEKTRGINE